MARFTLSPHNWETGETTLTMEYGGKGAMRKMTVSMLPWEPRNHPKVKQDQLRSAMRSLQEERRKKELAKYNQNSGESNDTL